MNRRDFLKLGGLFSTALVVHFNPLGALIIRFPEVERHGVLYRGTSDGKILLSENSGEMWALHTNFGSDFSIRSLSTDLSGQVNARLEFAGYLFDLVLASDGSAWKTA